MSGIFLRATYRFFVNRMSKTAFDTNGNRLVSLIAGHYTLQNTFWHRYSPEAFFLLVVFFAFVSFSVFFSAFFSVFTTFSFGALAFFTATTVPTGSLSNVLTRATSRRTSRKRAV